MTTPEDDFAHRLQDLAAAEAPRSAHLDTALANYRHSRARRSRAAGLSAVAAVAVVTAAAVGLPQLRGSAEVGPGGIGATASESASHEAAPSPSPTTEPLAGFDVDCATLPTSAPSGMHQVEPTPALAAVTLKPEDLGGGWHVATDWPTLTNASGESIDRQSHRVVTPMNAAVVVAQAQAASEHTWDAAADARITVWASATSVTAGAGGEVVKAALGSMLCGQADPPSNHEVLVGEIVTSQRQDGGGFVLARGRWEDMRTSFYAGFRWQGDVLTEVTVQGSQGDVATWDRCYVKNHADGSRCPTQPDPATIPGVTDWVTAASQAALDKALGKPLPAIPTLGG